MPKKVSEPHVGDAELLVAARNAVAEARANAMRRPLPQAMDVLAALVAQREAPAPASPDAPTA
jgi:hypothetical protein